MKNLLMHVFDVPATRKKKDNENLGALENIYRGRQTGVKQEAKRPIKENKISIDEKISCH